jgi:hypothetical protein
MNPKIVSERLGHASIVLTLDTYIHVLPNIQQAAADELEKILFGNFGTPERKGSFSAACNLLKMKCVRHDSNVRPCALQAIGQGLKQVPFSCKYYILLRAAVNQQGSK